MNNIILIKIVVFIAAFVASRMILHRVGKQLTDPQKEQIAAASESVFWMRNVLIIGAVAINVFLFRQSGEWREWIEILLKFGVPIGVVLLAIINFFQINRLGLPSAIRNGYLLSVFIFFIGIIFLLIPL